MSSLTLFIPGFYGSTLSDARTGTRHWLTTRHALLGRNSLTLSLAGESNHVPSGVLDRVEIIPGIYSVEVYGRFIQALSQGLAGNVIPLAYDWRLDPLVAVKQLSQMVQSARDRGVSKISIVAHSMGGLIASYYLRYGTQPVEEAKESWSGAAHIHKALFVAVPFRGAMAMFRDMLYGVPVGWNRRLLSRDAYASFPASYHLLPYQHEDVLVTHKGEELHGHIRRADSWRQNGWGLMKQGSAEGERFTQTWLQQSTRFYERLHAPLANRPNAPTQILNVAGAGSPTLARGLLEERRPQFKAKPLFREGDGAVTRRSAQLPQAFVKGLETRNEMGSPDHLQILTRQSEIVRWLKFLES